MTREEAKHMAAVLEAYAKVGVVQVKSGGRWMDMDEHDRPNFMSDPSDYRIKPEPKLRPWRPEEVPVGALVRCLDWNNLPSLIVGVERDGPIGVGYSDCIRRWEAGDMVKNNMEYSLDGGKTWQPCGVEESC